MQCCRKSGSVSSAIRLNKTKYFIKKAAVRMCWVLIITCARSAFAVDAIQSGLNAPLFVHTIIISFIQMPTLVSRWITTLFKINKIQDAPHNKH